MIKFKLNNYKNDNKSREYSESCANCSSRKCSNCMTYDVINNDRIVSFKYYNDAAKFESNLRR